MYARPGAAKLLLRPGSELLLHLNHGCEEDDDNDDDDDYDDDYDDYHNNVYVYMFVCVQRGAAAPLPEVLSALPLSTFRTPQLKNGSRFSLVVGQMDG